MVKMLKDRPLIFVGPMWRGLRSFIEHEIIERGSASPAGSRHGRLGGYPG